MVVGLISMLALGLVVSFAAAKKQVALDDVQASVTQALERARNRASSGVGNEDHGVYFAEDKIVVFEGSVYIEGEGEASTLPPLYSLAPADTAVIFSRLSAEADSANSFVITGPNEETRTVSVNENGSIYVE